MKRISVRQAIVAGVFLLANVAGQAFALSDCTLNNGASFSGVIVGSALTTSVGTTSSTFTGNINGTTLTVSSGLSGTVAVGQIVTATSGASFTTGTTITGNISGSGNGSTWTVTPTQNHTSNRSVSAAFASSTGTVATGEYILGASVPAQTTISSGSGNSWVLSNSGSITASTAMTASWDLTSTALTSLMQNSGSYTAGGTFIYEDDGTANDHEAWFSSGAVYDYKLGASSPTDPSKQVGTASVTIGTGTTPASITYTYGSNAYTWYISPQAAGVTGPATYNFCSNTLTGGGTVNAVVVHSGTN
jgi:hypothetical protein